MEECSTDRSASLCDNLKPTMVPLQEHILTCVSEFVVYPCKRLIAISGLI